MKLEAATAVEKEGRDIHKKNKVYLQNKKNQYATSNAVENKAYLPNTNPCCNPKSANQREAQILRQCAK